MPEDPRRLYFSESLGAAYKGSELAGRRILVIGAGQRAEQSATPDLVGNGCAISVVCAREGATVACADRDPAAAAQTVARIEAEGLAALAVAMDSSRIEECRAGIEAATRALGGLDGLVLNVGITTPNDFGQEDPGTWDALMNANLRAHMFAAQAAMPAMAPGGSMVLIGSTAAITPRGRMPAYEASKAALVSVGLSAALAGQEYSVRVNVVSPGIIDTPLGRHEERTKPARAARGAGPLPFGRRGTAWEVANVVAFLLGHRSTYVNGQHLIVDGGLSHGIVRDPD